MPDGRKTWQQWTDLPILDDDGELQEFQAVGLDITAQKKAELDLEVERVRLESILRTIDTVVWTAKLNPFRPEFVSEPIKKITGFTSEEFYQNPDLLNQMLLENEREETRKEFYKLIYIEGQFSSEIKIKTKNGEDKYLHFKAWLIPGNNGDEPRLEGVATDISERKHYEEKLIALNHSKDRILATVAHDLRNPISGIIGLCNMLEQKNPTSENLFYIDLIRRSSKTALGIMEELLEVAEMESQNFQLNRYKVCVNELIKGVLEHFETDALAKNIEMTASLPEVPLYADLNVNKFSRVLENLISNALKFTSEKGKVSVGLIDKTDKIEIFVKDTGIGIPKEMHHFLFEKFSRAKRFGLMGEKSHGLGMYITKQIVELHQGVIRFESKENKGTTFFIELNKSVKAKKDS
jgi:PAS domain S-box-containing protein